MTISPKTTPQTAKIVHAAAQLFARQGYHGTSTREIARIAEISENTLFRHFECKEDLFWAAFRSRLSGLEPRRDLLDSISKSAGPEVVVPLILAQLVDTTIVKPELLRLIAVAFIELNWKAASVCQEHLSPVFSAINHYFARSIESGKMRNLDSSLVTAAIASTVLVHPGFSRLIQGAHPPYADTGEAIRAYSRFWLELLSPQASNGLARAEA
jgi:AcrR family transcriptional regulator